MREYRRREEVERPRLRLVRGEDGRLRPAGDESINDIWAEQKRIRLAEALAEDERKAQKKQRRKEKLRSLFSKNKPASTARPPLPQANTPRSPKELVLNINFPKFKFKRPALPKIVKNRRVMVCAGIVLAVGLAGYILYNTVVADKKPRAKVDVLHANQPQTPQYATVLPKGKGIEQLGGWARVSPQDKEPVFAYADKIGDVPITVSQQPLPESFKDDIDSSMAMLAQGFTANQKLTAGDLTAYIGTSIHGPQSVVLAKHDLLLLIKSQSKIADQDWADYINSLE